MSQRYLACRSDLELELQQDLFGSEDIAGLLHGGVAEELFGIVRDRYRTVGDIGQHLGIILIVLVPFAHNRELGLVEEEVAFQLGELTGQTALTVEIQVSGVRDDVADIRAVFGTVDDHGRVLCIGKGCHSDRQSGDDDQKRKSGSNDPFHNFISCFLKKGFYEYNGFVLYNILLHFSRNGNSFFPVIRKFSASGDSP